MKILPSTDSDVMKLRSSAGCLSVMAFFFGAVIMACVFIPAAVRGGDEIPWYIGLPAGPALLAGSTYRRTIHIDRNAGSIVQRKSVVGCAFGETTYSQNAFDSVSLGHTRRITGDSGRAKSFYYATLSGGSSLTIMESGIVEQSRIIAEAVAVFLQLKLIDSATGNVIVREPELLALSVGERARQSGKRQSIPETPSDILTKLEFIDDTTAVLNIPPAGWSSRMMLSTWSGLLPGGFFLWLFHDFFDRERQTQEYVIAAIAFLFSSLCIFVSLGFVLSYFTRRVIVTVSAEELRVDSASFIRRTSQTMPAGEIMDVVTENIQRLAQSAEGNSRPTNFMIGGVGIRGNGKTIRFGNHLSEAEQTFLVQLIRAVLER